MGIVQKQTKVTYLGYSIEMLKYLQESRYFSVVNAVGVRGRGSDLLDPSDYGTISLLLVFISI